MQRAGRWSACAAVARGMEGAGRGVTPGPRSGTATPLAAGSFERLRQQSGKVIDAAIFRINVERRDASRIFDQDARPVLRGGASLGLGGRSYDHQHQAYERHAQSAHAGRVERPLRFLIGATVCLWPKGARTDRPAPEIVKYRQASLGGGTWTCFHDAERCWFCSSLQCRKRPLPTSRALHGSTRRCPNGRGRCASKGKRWRCC